MYGRGSGKKRTREVFFVLCASLGRALCPSWASLVLLGHAKCLQECLECLQECPKCLQERPKCLQECPKTRPK